MFKVMIEGKEVGSFRSFVEAFRAMFDRVEEMITRGTSWQMLETTCWIEKDGRYALGFYDARDLAYSMGLLKAGKLQDGAVDLPPEIMETAFASLQTAAFLVDLKERLACLDKTLSRP